MPFDVKKVDTDKSVQESATSGLRKISQILREQPKGEILMGVIGKEKEEPAKAAHPFNPESDIKRQTLSNFLKKVITPASNSKKHPNEALDQAILYNKLDKMELEELLRFVPDKVAWEKVEPDTLPLEYKIQINNIYRDISP